MLCKNDKVVEKDGNPMLTYSMKKYAQENYISEGLAVPRNESWWEWKTIIHAKI